MLESTLPDGLTDRLFTGQRLDSSTRLYYYNARYYDPHLGRFIQPDTLVPDPLNPQAWNRFSYTLNNPCIDPSGRQIELSQYQPGGFVGTDTTGPYLSSALPRSQGDYTTGGHDYAEWARKGVDLIDAAEASVLFVRGTQMLQGGFYLDAGLTYAGQTIVYGTADAKIAAGLVPQFTHAGAAHAALACYTNPWVAAGHAARGQLLGLAIVYGADIYEYGWGSKADVGLNSIEFVSALTADTAIQLAPPATLALIGTWVAPGPGTLLGTCFGIDFSLGWGHWGREGTIAWIDENRAHS